MECTLPLRIHVECSGCANLDGQYVQMKDASRAKPCYMKGGKKDPMFLYWLHKRWKLGSELDSHKSFAYTKDETGKEHPCDPSRTWKLFDRRTKEFRAAPSDMQVRCMEARPQANKRQLNSGEKEAPTPTVGTQGVSVGKVSPPAKLQPGPAHFLDDVPLQFKQKASWPATSDPNICSSSSPKKTLRPAELLRVAPEKCALDHESEATVAKTAAMFESRLRAVLSGVRDPEKQQMKLDTAKEKVISHKLVLAMKPELARNIIDLVQRDFGTKRQSKGVAAVQPLLSQEGLPSPKRPRIVPGQTGQPTTPPEKFKL